MATIKWVQTVDANQKELQNVKIHNVNGNPSTPVVGQIWYDTATGHLKYESASSVVIDPLARSQHTGTQTASTISDFDTQVRTSTLNQMTAPTADLSINSHKLTNVTDPSSAQDAATKTYVDTSVASAVAGVDWKRPVRVATTANGTLATAFANGQSVDGVSLVTGDRILLKNQTTGADNGIYTVNASGAPTRATDADSSAELQGGVIVAVDEGTTNNNTAWMLGSDIATVGTTSQSWVQFGAGTTYTASLGVQLVGNDIRANLGTGLTLSGNTIVPDYTGTNVMKRKIATGFVGTSGVDVTINHAFALADKGDCFVEVTENTSGLKVLCGITCSDTNNVILSFDTTPTTNQYRYQILGLS